MPWPLNYRTNLNSHKLLQTDFKATNILVFPRHVSFLNWKGRRENNSTKLNRLVYVTWIWHSSPLEVDFFRPPGTLAPEPPSSGVTTCQSALAFKSSHKDFSLLYSVYRMLSSHSLNRWTKISFNPLTSQKDINLQDYWEKHRKVSSFHIPTTTLDQPYNHIVFIHQICQICAQVFAACVSVESQLKQGSDVHKRASGQHETHL